MRNEVPTFARPDNLCGNMLVLPIASSRSEGEEHCLAVGQELRPAVGGLSFFQASERLWVASSVRHLL